MLRPEAVLMVGIVNDTNCSVGRRHSRGIAALWRVSVLVIVVRNRRGLRRASLAEPTRVIRVERYLTQTHIDT